MAKVIEVLPNIWHYPGYWDKEYSNFMFEYMKAQPWHQKEMTFTDKKIPLPRLTNWWGPRYKYSGIVNPEQEIPLLLDVWCKYFTDIVKPTAPFNSVLGNYYLDGKGSIGWHKDNEKEFTPDPLIISVSLGSTRTFQLREDSTKKITKVELGHGDMIYMGHGSQLNYDHSIPKENKGERINLTFRSVITNTP